MTVFTRGSPPEEPSASQPPAHPPNQPQQLNPSEFVQSAMNAGNTIVPDPNTNSGVSADLLQDRGIEPMVTSAPPVSPSHSPNPSLPEDEIGADISNGSVDVHNTDGSSDTDGEAPNFPADVLTQLDEQLSRQRWVVPVLPGQELETLILTAIKLCKRRLDVNNEACQRFYKDGLLLSFTRVMTDEAVKEWKQEILKHIYRICEKFLELCVLKLEDDSLALLEVLALVFNPRNRFYAMTQQRESDTMHELFAAKTYFASSPESGPPRGWLVDLLNKFGQLGGFQKILDRFTTGTNLNCSVICALLKPFGYCYEFLMPITVQTYLQEPIRVAHRYMQNITDDELKRETKGDARENSPMELVRFLRNLATRLPGQDNVVRELELLRLKVILRILQTSSFAGKMNALNEISKILLAVSSSTSTYAPTAAEEYLNAQQVVSWIRDNELLSVAIKENLHIIQYVEKLEKILRFMIKEKTLTLNDLDQLWAAQVGKHDAIVKNVHDLLAKVAWDFTAEQLDHLFGCFQRSWNDAPKKQREKLLELIRRLAEDDRDGRCADKVLQLLWNFARNSDIPTDIMDQALQCHAKILDYSCTQQKEQQKVAWLDRCIEEIRQENWVLPAMKHFRDICVQFPEGNANAYANWSSSTTANYRGRIISGLQTTHSLVALISTSLVRYMEKIRALVKEQEEKLRRDPSNSTPLPAIRIDGHYDHATQVQERLSFLKFVLRDGHLWLCDQQAKEIWDTLIVNPVFQIDREAGFKWFVKMMGDMADLDPEIQRSFFEDRVLQLDPHLLSEGGMKCFERFFKHVNTLDNRLFANDRRRLHINSFDLVGQEYLWRVVLSANEDIANRAIELVREVYTNPSPEMLEGTKLTQLHTDFIQSCMDRLKASYDTLGVLVNCPDKDTSNLIQQETARMTRVLRVLHGYIVAYDEQCNDDRIHVPLQRACLGRTIDLIIHFPQQGKHQPPVSMHPLEILTHGNQTLGGLKRQILQLLRYPVAAGNGGPANVLASRMRVDLMLNNGEVFDPADDRKILDELSIYGRMELQAKLHQTGRSGAAGNGSSPGSSSGESSPGESPSLERMNNGECEELLPSTWLCQKHDQIDFLLRISDLGTKLECASLRDWSRSVLRAIPSDVAVVTKIWELTEQASPIAGTQPSIIRECTSVSSANTLQSVFFASSPSEVLYSLELVYSMLVPARDSDPERTLMFQANFIKAGGIQACLATLLQNNFLSQTDATTKSTAFWFVLRLLRVLLSVAIHVRCNALATALRNPQAMANPAEYQALKTQCDFMTTFFMALPPQSDTLFNRLCVGWAERLHGINLMPDRNYPELDHARTVVKLAWAAAGGNPALYLAANPEDIHSSWLKKREINRETQNLCIDAQEVFLLHVIVNPTIMDSLLKEKFFQQCVIDLMFCPSDYIRGFAGDYLYYLAIKTYVLQPRILHFFITLLFTVLYSTAAENSRVCRDYFLLLRNLLLYGSNCSVSYQQVDHFLDKEVLWLKDARAYTMASMESHPEDFLLEGHLMITRALLGFSSAQTKYLIGSSPQGPALVKQLLEDFLLPSSRMFVEQKSQTIQRSMTIMGHMSENTRDGAGTSMMPRSVTTIYSPTRCVPVCGSVHTMIAAYDLIVALCTNCVENMQTIVRLLNEMYFDDNLFNISEWEYAPPVNLRNASLFVGLKNGGATCYMNSVFQQLFMIEPLRNAILTAASSTYCVDDSDNEEAAVVQGPVLPPMQQQSPHPAPSSCAPANDTSESCSSVSSAPEKTATADVRKEYNMGVLQCVQLIFANLLGSQLQFYVPRKFWKCFRFGNELINLREQHDALEFFNSLVDSVDEALKAMGEPQICNKIFGGTFADQKICKGCPHRYSMEQPFTTLSLDVRNHHNLVDSLQEYVKGDLLESENAYLCEKCNRKVNAIKRLCIKKLPPILVIQLKRFDFDWEREQAVKFNDYFEFQREIDMEPYTVEGLAKLEGEILTDAENNNEKSNEQQQEKVSTHYKLRGITVHSGQASGGHYYSFILQRLPNGQQKWFKFDDGDVTEYSLENDEDMRNQCFGGEYTSEVFDQYLRRMQQRRHKRWWNAYILFYERSDATEIVPTKLFECMTLSGRARQMPPLLEDIVNRKNMKSCHRRNQFTIEFFHFIRQLCSVHWQIFRAGQASLEDPNFSTLLLLSTQLVSKFLFTTGLRAKRNLRGNPQDWTELMNCLFRSSPAGRIWFATEILYKHITRFTEYLLECPSADVRMIFARILAYLAHFGHKDRAINVETIPERLSYDFDSLSDVLIRTVLLLLQKEVSEYGRHLKEYFGLFQFYATLGPEEKRQLLRFNIPVIFINVVLDEGPGQSIKGLSVELQKLYGTLSLLIRGCDMSPYCKTSDGKPLAPNPWQEHLENPPVMNVTLAERLYNESPSKILKKFVEETLNYDDTVTLLKFLSWENFSLSKTILACLQQQARYGMPDVRPVLDCWLQLLLLDDSWAEKRILISFRGSDDQEGLFAYIQLQCSHNPRRSYLFIKMITSLCEASPVALRVLQNHPDLSRKWREMTAWMHSELITRQQYGSPYGYNSWSPPVHSNEAGNGSYLERTKSAKITLSKVMHIAQNLPRDEKEEAQSEGQSDDDATSGDPEPEILGSTGVDIPSHPPPPYSPRGTVQIPPPPPPPSQPEPEKGEKLDWGMFETAKQKSKEDTAEHTTGRIRQSVSDPSNVGTAERETDAHETRDGKAKDGTL